MTKYTLNKMV